MSNQPKQHGGLRQGAGRKPNVPVLVGNLPATNDPRAFLEAVMNSLELDIKLRLAAAMALMPYAHPKLVAAGKKNQCQDMAKIAGSGRYAASMPPLKLIN